MFKKFSKADVHTRSALKSSIVKNLKSKLTTQYPLLTPHIDEIIPKKAPLTLYKCEDKIQLYLLNDEVLFWQKFDELIPSLKLVHKYPYAFPRVRTDRGAIKFVVGGANVMCPGLTSPGAQMPDGPLNTEEENEALAADGAEDIQKGGEDWGEGTIVTIYAEGKEHAMATGILAMSVKDIKEQNKGTGIDLYEYLGDGLWCLEA